MTAPTRRAREALARAREIVPHCATSDAAIRAGYLAELGEVLAVLAATLDDVERDAWADLELPDDPRCVVCRRAMPGVRADRSTCSSACRKAKSREERRRAEVTERRKIRDLDAAPLVDGGPLFSSFAVDAAPAQPRQRTRPATSG